LVRGEKLSLKPGPNLVALGRLLQRLHNVSWPHGDLKPENIRVADDGKITLIDPLPIGSELLTPEWIHLNFLVSTPLVSSADPRDRRMEFRYRDLIALALMISQSFANERPWGHPEVARMLDRGITMNAKREELIIARERLKKITPRIPSALRPFVTLALEPGLWPEEGPMFAAYLQARPFESRCEALATFQVGTLLAEVCG
jgi:serine/threonine protein kinase